MRLSTSKMYYTFLLKREKITNSYIYICFAFKMWLKGMDQRRKKEIWLKLIMYAGGQMGILFIGTSVVLYAEEINSHSTRQFFHVKAWQGCIILLIT